MSETSVLGSNTMIAGRLYGIISTTVIERLLKILLALSLAVVVLGVFRQTAGGDEFIFLNNIHRAAKGESVGLLQTAHVHLFRWWLPFVGQHELAQITIGRAIYAGIWAGSLMLLYRVGRRLLDPLAALAGTVLFAVFGSCVVNAASFRIDGLLLPILLSVALLLLNPTTLRVAAAGALSAVALALTIKTVLWAPAFIAVLAVTLWDRSHWLRTVVAGALTGAVAYAGIMLVHAWMIATEAAALPGVPVDRLKTIGSYMFFEGFIPQWDFLKTALIFNPATWLLLVIGVCLALADLRQPQSRRNALVLLCLALPVLSVTFYTNAFPYAYLVLMPTACLLAGKAFSRFMGTGEGLKGVAALVCMGSAALPMVVFGWAYYQYDEQKGEREVLVTVHQLFDRPVPYIDVSGMVASFPRDMPAITKAVLVPYRRAGVPRVANYIHEAKPPLLIANSNSLDMWTEGVLEDVDPDVRLLPQDEDAIRATYAHYWDQIYLAGRQWSDVAPGAARAFDIVVPGDHTLIANHPVVVDGRTYAPGATLGLDAGPHELRTTAAEPDLRILWGKGLQIPAQD